MSQTNDTARASQPTTSTTDEIPNPETGIGIGARSEPDSFEPEEDPE